MVQECIHIDGKLLHSQILLLALVRLMVVPKGCYILEYDIDCVSRYL